jgi:hypothetical protein
MTSAQASKAVSPNACVNARGHPHDPVERDPAEELGVEKVARAAANLPDTVVGLAPAQDGLVGHVSQRVPQFRPDGQAHPLVVQVGGVYHLAANIELLLSAGAVTHAHGPRAAVAFQVF